MSSGFLTEEEVRSYLDVSPQELERLIRSRKLTAFRVGGEYLRYRKEEVMAVRNGRKFRPADQLERSWFDKIRDFLNFYSIYILLTILIVLLAIYFVEL